MAAPADKNIKNLTGQWSLNRTASDQFEEALKIQSLSWVTRKALLNTPLTLHIRQFTNDDGAECIHIDQVAVGITASTERRTVDGEQRQIEDVVFGKCTSRTRRISREQLDAATDDEIPAYDRLGWDDQTAELGYIHTRADNAEYGWTANQIWGFADDADVAGEKVRTYVRRLKIYNAEAAHEFRLVYTYVGELPAEPEQA